MTIEKASTLIAYHGNPEIKLEYLDRVRAHRKADRLVAGLGWAGGKGCAVGCTLEDYDHSKYPLKLGVPEHLAHLQDAIFEGLARTDEDHLAFPELFLSAIMPGADLAMVWPRFVLGLLSDDESPTVQSMGESEQVREAVGGVASLYDEWIETGVQPSRERFGAAAKSAEASAAARTAARSAEASAAAWAAEASAEASAEARAARTAEWAGAAAARAAARAAEASAEASTAARSAEAEARAARTAVAAARTAEASAEASWAAATAARAARTTEASAEALAAASAAARARVEEAAAWASPTARTAARSAEAAATAEAAAAARVEEAAAWVWMRDLLLRLLGEAPMSDPNVEAEGENQ
jgi:hypothetical protein